MSHRSSMLLLLTTTFEQLVRILWYRIKDSSALYLCLYNHIEQTMLTFGGRGTSTHVLLSMRALYSSHIACFQLGSRRAWKGDLEIGEGGDNMRWWCGGGGWLVGCRGFVLLVMVLIEELEVLIVELFVDLFMGLFVVVFVEENWSHGAEGKDSFVKCDMSRNDNFVGVQVKALISAMINKNFHEASNVDDVFCGL
ncbi:hypothetical protein Tco_0579529 [Tanacetum coccineum]